MTSHNAPRPRGRPSLTGGRAQTVQTSLSPSQAAWVASRGVPVAAYLRGLVERDQESKSKVVRGSYGTSFREAMSEPGGDPSKEPGRCATRFTDGWAAYRDGASVGYNLTESQAIDWCLTGTLPDLVKIGGDV
jgi:hypothetical protein